MFKGCEEEKERNRGSLGMGGKKKWEKDSGQGGLGIQDEAWAMVLTVETVTQRDAEGPKGMETQRQEK